jgi:tRNA nucleotidyltransferase (CCA-adding enzyme)
MHATVKDICSQILSKIIPSAEEERRILRLANEVRSRTEQAADNLGLNAEVRIEGSVAKGTWLSGETDIDIFVRLPTKEKREKFRDICKQIANNAFQKCKQVERFAEHPYLEVWVDDVKVNIVPCYQVKQGGWLSATDRTPFHTLYVKDRITSLRLKNEVRLLKKFMKGVGVYGAEIKVGGFSGYLCELLTLHYGSFCKLIEDAIALKGGVIDLEGHYEGDVQKAKKIFRASLIVVDPIDKSRNVAAAVLKDKVDQFVAASRCFLKRPDLSFFEPPPTKPISTDLLSQKLQRRGTCLICVKFGKVNAVPDVLWGQLYKSLRALENLLSQHEFEVLRSAAWSDEVANNIFLLEVRSRFLPPVKLHKGPPVSLGDVDAFLRKHLGGAHVFSGPWVEKGRWFIEVERRYTDAVKLLYDKLRKGGREIGIASLIADSIKRSITTLVNEEVLDLYLSSPDFAGFLTDFLLGKPKWLPQ